MRLNARALLRRDLDKFEKLAAVIQISRQIITMAEGQLSDASGSGPAGPARMCLDPGLFGRPPWNFKWNWGDYLIRVFPDGGREGEDREKASYPLRATFRRFKRFP